MLIEYMNRLIRKTFGFSLIETLVAFMLVAIMGGAVVYILAQVVSVTKSAEQKSRATSYANQGVEAVRDYYQTNLWLSLSGRDASIHPTCYKSVSLVDAAVATCKFVFDSVNPTLYYESLAGGFYRQISVLTVSPKVTVVTYVFWLEKGIAKMVKVEAAFYNY